MTSLCGKDSRSVSGKFLHTRFLFSQKANDNDEHGVLEPYWTTVCAHAVFPNLLCAHWTCVFQYAPMRTEPACFNTLRREPAYFTKHQPKKNEREKKEKMVGIWVAPLSHQTDYWRKGHFPVRIISADLSIVRIRDSPHISRKRRFFKMRPLV